MKIIAISQRIDTSDYNEIRPQLDIRLYNFIASAGYTPVPIPYYSFRKIRNDVLLKKWLVKIQPSGIVLSGGENIGSRIIRDNTEYFLINFSKKNASHY